MITEKQRKARKRNHLIFRTRGISACIKQLAGRYAAELQGNGVLNDKDHDAFLQVALLLKLADYKLRRAVKYLDEVKKA